MTFALPPDQRPRLSAWKAGDAGAWLLLVLCFIIPRHPGPPHPRHRFSTFRFGRN